MTGTKKKKIRGKMVYSPHKKCPFKYPNFFLVNALRTIKKMYIYFIFYFIKLLCWSYTQSEQVAETLCSKVC